MQLAAAATAASPACSAQQALSRAGSRAGSPEPQPDLNNEEAVRLAGLALHLAQVRWGCGGGASAHAGRAFLVQGKAAGRAPVPLGSARPCPVPSHCRPAPSPPKQGDVNHAMAHLLTWAAAQ